jgi:hypothetical protein
MDILNFISWIRGSRVVNSVDPAKTLLPVGLKDNRRDDGYLAGAISVEDFTNQVKPYKVFTALLTQSGGDVESDKNASDEFFSGVTYYISSNTENKDFTIYGAPNNNVGTYFLCTQNGIVPNGAQLIYNYGAPVVTVLENTIGNVWFTYNGIGSYSINSNGPFIESKTSLNIGTLNTLSNAYNARIYGDISSYPNSIGIQLRDSNFDATDGGLYNTPIEIRVYN